ncbi:conserved hypothetical protein [Ricinus communis]|uniref:Endonuclease/exonuclease/phosphatase domain-containing protein n=1 Tax=Ricinus communis TaxID=3988 RepID=B9T0C3_RICCO|nr:conserved hypothetical protein [Ricinus communis]
MAGQMGTFLNNFSIYTSEPPYSGAYLVNGLGYSQTVQELMDLVSKSKLEVIFLMEVNVRVNNEGGLAMFWKDRAVAHLVNFSKNFIDIELSFKDSPSWHFTSFYGCLERSRSLFLWNLPKNLQNYSSLPWFCISDFNDLGQYEKYDQWGTKQIVRWLQFKNSWIREAGCRDLIKRCWSQSARVDIQKRIRMCGISLAKWGMGLKAQFRPQVTVCKRHINELKARSDNSSVRELEEACHELNEILAQQEKIWQQRAKRFRLNEGDSNTHYFHKAVIA